MIGSRQRVAADVGAGLLGIDWGAFALVFGVSLSVTLAIVVSFAFGTRILAIGAPDVVAAPGEEADGPNAVTPPRTEPRPVGLTIAGWALYGVGIVATLVGIYLVVPIFHGA